MNPLMLELTTADFEKTIAHGKTVVDFWAPWCGPCRFFAPVYEAVAKEHKGITFAKVNVDEHPEISGTYGVRGIPTTIFFQDGKPIGKQVGAMDKSQFEDLLKQLYK